MKVFFRAFLWSIGFEIVLVVPILVANRISLGAFDFIPGVLAYLGLFCHAPAFYLLHHWPKVQETLLMPILVQWFIWFILILIIFAISRLIRKRSLGHETHTA
jgi:hypothetical protein